MALVDNNGIGIIVFSAKFLHNPSGEQFINGLEWFRNTLILFSLTIKINVEILFN